MCGFRISCASRWRNQIRIFEVSKPGHEGDSLRQPERCKVEREPGQIAYSAVASAFKAACEKAGLVNLTLHSCRRTAATEMAIEGYSVLEIRDMLHHQDMTTTLRYINQMAVTEVRRQKRNQLKLSGLPCDTTSFAESGLEPAYHTEPYYIGTTQTRNRSQNRDSDPKKA